MSTNSTIWIKQKDDAFQGIYCHHDGYLDHNGVILLENYTTTAMVKRLIRLGSLSVLAKKSTKPRGHSYDHPVKGHCIAYHRDRGEDLHQLRASNEGKTKQEGYNYLWIDNQWWVSTPAHYVLLVERLNY